MPIYEYVCEKCSSKIEVMQKVADAPLKRCRDCKGKLEKILSRTSFHLKGSGWHATDYAAKPTPGNGDKSDKGSDKKVESSTSADATSGTGAPKPA